MGLVGLSVDEVAFEVEVIVDVGVDGGALLQALHLPEPQHRPLSSSEREVAGMQEQVRHKGQVLTFERPRWALIGTAVAGR